MARFRFLAVDSSGRSKRGVMDAGNQTDAVARIEKQGLQVRQIVPEPTLEADDGPPPAPQQVHALRLGGNVVALVLACLAIAVAFVALAVAVVGLFRDPLGSGISRYDFSSPRAALVSGMKVRMNQDIRALIELESKVASKKLKEKLDTVNVSKEVEFKGKKLLFVRFKADGINKYEVASFEKDANSGYWLPAYVSAYEVEKDNKALAAQMRRWEESGELRNE